MATVTFRSNDNFLIPAGSGLGFYAAPGFGASVAVGSWQDRTYITNGAGTIQGAETDNVKFIHTNSGIIGPGASGVPINLRQIPNYQTTLNIRFTHSTAVDTQNAVVQIYDRVDTSNAASGVVCFVAEIIHPEVSQAVTGSGDTAWIDASGSSTTVSLVNSPTTSGLGDGATDIQHDWYLALTSKPRSIGSKELYGLYFSVEYV